MKAPTTDLKSLDEDKLLEHKRRIRRESAAKKKRKNMNSEDRQLPNQPATPDRGFASSPVMLYNQYGEPINPYMMNYAAHRKAGRNCS
jgi:hypothetical protein